MFKEILIQAWIALRRNPTRATLTMCGIMWGVVSVALLFAYGSGFRAQLVRGFDAFGKSAVVVWPGQTSDQAGGEKAGKRVRFELEDFNNIRAEGTLVRHLSLETVQRYDVGYELRRESAAIRGVYPSYGEVRNEVPSQGRWISDEDMLERRRVAFLGSEIKKKLFSGRPALGEEIIIGGLRFTVIGVMDRACRNEIDRLSGVAALAVSQVEIRWGAFRDAGCILGCASFESRLPALGAISGVISSPFRASASPQAAWPARLGSQAWR